jgi:hypothetical protein
MLERLTSKRRALFSSVAYTTLVALVVVLAYLTFRGAEKSREIVSSPENIEDRPLVEFDQYASRLERSSDSERVNVSLRLRLTAPGNLDCQVFIVARNDRVEPKLWGVWPPQGPEGAITAGGHFRGGEAKGGEALTLTTGWTRVSGSIAHPLGAPPFETVMVYVVGPRGEVLLARPFPLPGE